VGETTGLGELVPDSGDTFTEWTPTVDDPQWQVALSTA
jgi:hypothetical protein